MYVPCKQYLKRYFPFIFRKFRDIKDQAIIEINTLRQVGFLRILRQFSEAKENWKSELPVQKINRINLNFDSLQSLRKSCKKFKEGGHVFYFSPEVIQNSPLKDAGGYMPRDFGVKVVKRSGGISMPFAAPNKTCKIHSFISPSHQELVLVHGIFYILDMGPRLYDLLEIEFQNGDVHAAYILEHIEGEVCSSKEDCEVFIEKIKHMESSNLVKLVNWNGYKDMDFTCPHCNKNLIFDKHLKKLKYVDLQNFALGNYYDYLKKTALDASCISHFGQKSYLMGGEYLYQEIPGLNLAAKRSPVDRFRIFRKALEGLKLEIKNKLVIDVGCNIGLMGAQYLKEGAAWVHGFDMPEVVLSTERILLSVGCTRFSTTGVTLRPETSLLDNLPQHLKNYLKGCVISYLAIRGHIGWVKELGKIPWNFMLYESHQGEDKDTNHQFINELNQIKKCFIAFEGWISDANSSPRYIAIIKADMEL